LIKNHSGSLSSWLSYRSFFKPPLKTYKLPEPAKTVLLTVRTLRSFEPGFSLLCTYFKTSKVKVKFLLYYMEPTYFILNNEIR